MEDFVLVMCWFWCGEIIVGYMGFMGEYLFLRIDFSYDENIFFGLVVFGLNFLVFGGCVFDDVILYMFFMDEIIEKSVWIVK